MKPTVGRIVHFHKDVPGWGNKPLAAIITEVHSDTCVNLCAFGPGGQPFSETSVLQGKQAGQYWEWPPRVES